MCVTFECLKSCYFVYCIMVLDAKIVKIMRIIYYGMFMPKMWVNITLPKLYIFAGGFKKYRININK